MKYKVIEGNDFPDMPTFEELVNEAIEAGWKPIGGVSAFVVSNHIKGLMLKNYIRKQYAQAMILGD